MKHRSRNILTKEVDDLDYAQKAAIVLLSLDHTTSSELIRSLPQELLEKVTRTIATIGEVPRELTEMVLEEFHGFGLSESESTQGSVSYAKSLIEQSLDRTTSKELTRQLDDEVTDDVAHNLYSAEPADLMEVIQEEHPQTIAFILSGLTESKASETLSGLPPHKQVEVVRRLANLGSIDPEISNDIGRRIGSLISSRVAQPTEDLGGVETVASILNSCDRTTEKSILEGIEADDPDLGEEIRRRMFVFEDIIKVTNRGIQAILKEIDNEELCLALKTASEEMKEKMFSNMSERASGMIREDMEYKGPVRISDVESAQQRIVDVVRRLEDAGDVLIPGRGGDHDLVV